CEVLSLASARLITFDQNGVAETEPALSAILSEATLATTLRSGTALSSQVCPPSFAKWAEAQGIRNFAVVPGIGGGRLRCVLFVHNHLENYEFHVSAMRYLQALTAQCALSLANANLFAQLQQNNLELESANRKLRELDRLRSQFLSIATHELRTPLTIIMG